MEEKVELLICERCSILLMRIDKRYIAYTSGEFNGDVYEDNDNFGDDSFDGYVCPRCGGIDHEVLKHILVPKDAASTIKKLWDKVFTAYEDTATSHGIPLSNPALKELLTEHLI